MKVSLERFLRTGQFGELSFGLSSQQVRELLGEPEATARKSRKNPHPVCYKYGSVEIWFSSSRPFGIWMVCCDLDEGTFRLPARCEIEDCALTLEMHQAEIETLLSDWQMEFASDSEVLFESCETITIWTLSSGVQMNFDEQGRLIYLSSRQRE